MPPLVRAADLFCGAGGSSTGLARACQDAGRKLQLTAVNHWGLAVETHALNHPGARHFCEPVDSIDPRRAVPEGRLDLLWASPECTHHSNARGGKPVNDQSRASAWCVLRWATALRIDTILIENVPEFTTWGPLGADGRPLKRRKGETFAAFLDALRSLGYRVDWRILNAADYGDPTTRQRLYVQARRGRRPLLWPDATHAPGGADTLFGRLRPWRPAREVIDWLNRGTSIFGRKRPLSPNTVARIAAGLRRFGGKAAEPFLLLLTHGGRLHSCDRPLPTVTGANRGEMALVQPFIVAYHNDKAPRDGARRTHDLSAPLPTLDTSNRFGLVQPFVLQMSQSGSNGRRMRPAGEPLPTVTTADDLAIVKPFIVKYTRTGSAYSVDEPLDTISTRDRFGLVTADAGPVLLDILFRMLGPPELARAMSFPEGYRFAGNRENTVKQIGNAVPCEQARALCRAVLFAA